MPAEKRTAEDRKNAKPQQRKYHVRLKRGGQHGEEGLCRHYFKGKLYKREGIYRVDQKTRVALKRTGKFEDILPEDLEQAKQESAAGRGVTLQARARVKRREAQRSRRRRFAAQVDEDEDEDDLDGYELGDDDVDPELADDPDDDPDDDPEEEHLAV